MRFTSFHDLLVRPCAWLCPGIALGELTLIDGDTGLGKSLLTLDLCARLSTDRPCPDGSPGLTGASAIVLNTDDNAEATVKPRLLAMGADLTRIFLPTREEHDPDEPLRLPSQLPILERTVAETAARLVVIDPILDHLDPNVNTASYASVSRALRPLRDLARRHQCAVLLIRHLSKKGGRRAIYRGLESIAFLSFCRCGWLVAPDPRLPQCRVLAPLKMNLAAPPPSLAYEVLPAPDNAATLSWLGPTDWTADQLLAAAGQSPPRPSRRARAREFLETFLQDGPRTSHDLWNAARKQGLSSRTLNRAKRDLDIQTAWVTVDGAPRTFWLLPGQQAPSSADSSTGPAILEPWLAPLREQFPSRNPLDDP